MFNENNDYKDIKDILLNNKIIENYNINEKFFKKRIII